MIHELLESDSIHQIIQKGAAISRYDSTLVNRVAKSAYRIKICGFDIPVVNTCFFKGEVLDLLDRGEPFAAAYHFDGEKYIFSLRSEANGLDVSKIAETFQGGGHQHASGFSLKSLEELNS